MANNDLVKKLDYTRSLNALGFVLLGLLYGVSPIDIIPDIPVIGWTDDVLVLILTTLNLIVQLLTDIAGTMAQIAEELKNIRVVLYVIAILLLLLCVFQIYTFFT